MALLVVMVVLGCLYALFLVANLNQLSSLVFILADPIAVAFGYFVEVYIGVAILYGIFRRRRRSAAAVDQAQMERVLRLVEGTQARMMFRPRVTFTVLPRSATAFYRGKNRIVLGEKLVKNMDDQQLSGVIGHELAHDIMHHIPIKAAMFWGLVGFLFVLSYFTEYLVGGRILYWTLGCIVVLAEMPLSWKLEYAADAKAAMFLGSKIVVETLLKLRTFYFDGISYSHPSLSARIGKLQALNGPL